MVGEEINVFTLSYRECSLSELNFRIERGRVLENGSNRTIRSGNRKRSNTDLPRRSPGPWT